jgi:hypothetical protein
MARNKRLDPEFVRAAILGFEQERTKIEAKMDELRRALAGSAAPRSSSSPRPRKSGRRELSPAARERIAAAQRRRWAAYKRAKATKAKARAAA